MENLEEIKKELLQCERLYYFGVCILKENRILKKVLIDLSKIAKKLIYAFTYERNFEDEKERILFFIKNYLKKILSEEEIKNFVEIVKFYKMHEKSSLEFVRKDKLIVYYDGKYETITKEKIIEGLNLIKSLLKRISED